MGQTGIFREPYAYIPHRSASAGPGGTTSESAVHLATIIDILLTCADLNAVIQPHSGIPCDGLGFIIQLEPCFALHTAGSTAQHSTAQHSTATQ